MQDLRLLYQDDPGIRFLAKPSGAEAIMEAAQSLLAPFQEAAAVA
jgi:hypothetical protein